MFIAAQYDYLSHKVEYVGPPSEDYKENKEYEVLFQKLSDGRYAVFKSSTHYRESPGYKVFKSKEEISSQFKPVINANESNPKN
jgi:hypothetical protein